MSFAAHQTRTVSIVLRIMAGTMILFGVAEVVTSFRHRFFVIETAHTGAETVAGSFTAGCYIVAGVLILVGRRWTARVALGLLILDVVGRIGMTVAGLFPVNTPTQIIGIGAGTAIALAFTVALAAKLRSFP